MKTNAKLEAIRKEQEEHMAKLSPEKQIELLVGIFEWATGYRPSKKIIDSWRKQR